MILCISTYSATAPLTAFAKQYGFRGATLHGVNPVILASGLSVDYDEVSKEAEKLRLGLTRADNVEIEFGYGGKTYRLRLDLGGQEAQKSHGLCRGGPDVANLPAGEVYFVPKGAEGEFPMKYEDGTLGLMTVRDGRVVDATLLQGSENTVAAHRDKLRSDPATGELGELGLRHAKAPVSGRDIQDEKIFGTFHIATGRSDHLGGGITPDRFEHKGNATHDDILYSPTKTPEIMGERVVMRRNRRIGDGHREIQAYRVPAQSDRAVMPVNLYETDRLLAEYLLFHYGQPEEILPWSFGPSGALDFAVRVVSESLDFASLPASARALDLGCAVGRSSFELARHCQTVVGIDSSANFIRAANGLRIRGSLPYARTDEGRLVTPLEARVPAEIDRQRVQFETGDAGALRADLGRFDTALLINLIDRLPEPQRCLDQLPGLLDPGAQLVIASPYTWMEEYTSLDNWLGGYELADKRVSTFDTLREKLAPDFDFVRSVDLPFLIREHTRKFQWSVSRAGVWRKRQAVS